MTPRTAARIAWAAAGLSVAMGLAGLGFDIVQLETHPSFVLGPILAIFYGVAFSLIGALIVSRFRENVFGWIFTILGMLFTFAVAGQAYAGFAVANQHGSWPAGIAIAWLADWIWIPISALAVIFVPLLFPTGRLLSPRWRIFVWSAVAFMLLAGMGNAFMPGPILSNLTRNPVGIDRLAGFLHDLINLSVIPLYVGLLGAVGSLVIRFRRARGQERQQLKWFLFGCILFLVPWAARVPAVPQQIQTLLWALLLPALPISIGVAMLKYRLYDIDLVINKSLVLGALAVFITAVYVGIVVGIGALVGTRGQPNLALSILATAVVAVAFQPVRERVQRLANRLVYGKRATPYEVMAGFSERMAGVLSIDEVLPRMAEAAAKGVAAVRSRVRLNLPDGSERSTSWPTASSDDHFDRTLRVMHRGEPVGEIAVVKPAGEPLSPAEDKLLSDLATQAGLVLHNVRLTLELQARLAEISARAAMLRASRQRIVAAQDAERARLEQTIRDGAQRQLASMEDRLSQAEQVLEKDAAAAVSLLDHLTRQANETLEGLRDLARGIYPPLLRDQGLVAALRSQAAKIGKPVEVAAEGVGRYPSEVEATVYFCCLEALGGAFDPARLDLAGDGQWLSFAVSGSGFADGRRQDMEDRVEALGGSLEVRDEALVGRVPVSHA